MLSHFLAQTHCSKFKPSGPQITLGPPRLHLPFLPLGILSRPTPSLAVESLQGPPASRGGSPAILPSVVGSPCSPLRGRDPILANGCLVCGVHLWMTKNSSEAKRMPEPGQDWDAAVSSSCSQLDLVWEGDSVAKAISQPYPHLGPPHPGPPSHLSQRLPLFKSGKYWV